MSNVIARCSTDVGDLVQEEKVHKSLYSNQELFEEELDRVFNNTWVWVAHESEVAEAGAYKTAMIGKQPVIVVKDRKQNIHVLENRCKHRGATVCEGKKGKTRAFTCPYHGWGYGLDGGLRALPKPGEYEGILDKAYVGGKKKGDPKSLDPEKLEEK